MTETPRANGGLVRGPRTVLVDDGCPVPPRDYDLLARLAAALNNARLDATLRVLDDEVARRVAVDKAATEQALRTAAHHRGKAAGRTDAEMLRSAAGRIGAGFSPGGHATTDVVVRVLRAVADVIEDE